VNDVMEVQAHLAEWVKYKGFERTHSPVAMRTIVSGWWQLEDDEKPTRFVIGIPTMKLLKLATRNAIWKFLEDTISEKKCEAVTMIPFRSSLEDAYFCGVTQDESREALGIEVRGDEA